MVACPFHCWLGGISAGRSVEPQWRSPWANPRRLADRFITRDRLVAVAHGQVQAVLTTEFVDSDR